MSNLFVDKISGKSGTSSGAPITLSGDTATLGSGVTIPAAGVTGTLPVGVTGGSGLDALPNTSSISQWGITAFTASGMTDPLTSWQSTTIAGSSIPTESSGIFSFPSTGYWEIDCRYNFYVDSATAVEAENISFYCSFSYDSGSSWTKEAIGQHNFHSPANDWWRASVHVHTIVEITNISTFRAKFKTYAYAGSLYQSMNGDNGHVLLRKLGEI